MTILHTSKNILFLDRVHAQTQNIKFIDEKLSGCKSTRCCENYYFSILFQDQAAILLLLESHNIKGISLMTMNANKNKVLRKVIVSGGCTYGKLSKHNAVKPSEFKIFNPFIYYDTVNIEKLSD